MPNIERAGGDRALTGLEHVAIADLLAQHDRGRSWGEEELRSAHRQHALFGWARHDPAAHDAALSVSHGEGVFLVESGSGRRIFDMNAGGMCNSLGHSLSPDIIEEITDQLRGLTYTWPDNTITPIRARLCSLLAAVLPGDLDHFMFPSSGAEANEACVRIARAVTGRQKVLSSYRSYHGGTTTAMAMTGDSRRWGAEAGAAGHAHFMPAHPYSYRRGAGDESDAQAAERALAELREQVHLEGAQTIASIVLEGVTGTNGTMKHPPGYLEGVRSLCDEHGILMHCDEIMSGWGRTGKLFGFQHSDGVIPDLIASSKGTATAVEPSTPPSDRLSSPHHGALASRAQQRGAPPRHGRDARQRRRAAEGGAGRHRLDI